LTLTVFLGRSGVDGPSLSPTVTAGDEVRAGQPLATIGKVPQAPSPVCGKVAAVRQAPDVRGGKPGLAVSLAPSGNGAPPFPPIDWTSASVEALRSRLREAGVRPDLPEEADAVVILAADPEPGLSSALRLLLDDPDGAIRAARMVARLAGARRTFLAVLRPHADALRELADGTGVEILPLRPEYPATLPAVVARNVESGDGEPAVIPIALARAALEAAEQGRVPSSTLVTVLAPGGVVAGNYRVSVGAGLGSVLAAAGLKVTPGDTILTGGLFRGLAQYSLEAAVDAGVSAVALVKKGTAPAWSDEPCVNCGACIDVCPENLQAHQLARFAEFGLFDRTPEYGLHDCIECGLCATVCPARRPLLQRIRIAKREVAAAGGREASRA
jgi:electron transport complex protein RnfC